jgi:hypothetical protein
MIQFFIAFGIFFSAELRLVNPEGEATNQKPWLLTAACHAEPVEAWLPLTT